MADFSSAIGRGGVVTVMNAMVYSINSDTVKTWSGSTPAQVVSALTGTLSTSSTAYIDHLKFANLNADGPDITITGGQYANPLIKFGKSMRCEMQAALCDINALKALGGVEGNDTDGYSVTDKFPGPVAILGDTFIIDQATGDQVDAKIIVYQFLPDAIISLTQDEATAATFDMNGDVLSVKVLSTSTATRPSAAFYSIVDGSAA